MGKRRLGFLDAYFSGLDKMAEKELKYLVRVMNTDLDGKKQIPIALSKIKGVKFSLANALCAVAGIDSRKKAGYLSDAEVKKLNDVLADPIQFGVPEWMTNRQKDPETGESKHVCVSDLQFLKDNDMKNLKKTKSYRGMRHQWGLTTRGQRTKANFRRTKVKGGSLGVVRKKGKK